MSNIETTMMGLRAKTPQNVLQMKWMELKLAEARTFTDINKTHNMTTLNGTSASTMASLSTIVEEMRKSKNVGRNQDEGKSHYKCYKVSNTPHNKHFLCTNLIVTNQPGFYGFSINNCVCLHVSLCFDLYFCLRFSVHLNYQKDTLQRTALTAIVRVTIREDSFQTVPQDDQWVHSHLL